MSKLKRIIRLWPFQNLELRWWPKTMSERRFTYRTRSPLEHFETGKPMDVIGLIENTAKKYQKATRK
jgi:hypothetical protein